LHEPDKFVIVKKGTSNHASNYL